MNSQNNFPFCRFAKSNGSTRKVKLIQNRMRLEWILSEAVKHAVEL